MAPGERNRTSDAPFFALENVMFRVAMCPVLSEKSDVWHSRT